VRSYQCAEASGAIWIKAGANGENPPTLAMDGWDFAGVQFNKVCAPLELVIDNFSEVEHTMTTHPDFGFDREQASQAVVELETAEDSITVRNHGPAKMPPLDTRLAVAIRRGDRFHSNYTFRLDPPRSSVTPSVDQSAHWSGAYGQVLRPALFRPGRRNDDYYRDFWGS
jgi:vanillate O-demethylase monooxygenase subunit